jgi:hypothetical protein
MLKLGIEIYGGLIQISIITIIAQFILLICGTMIITLGE